MRVGEVLRDANLISHDAVTLGVALNEFTEHEIRLLKLTAPAIKICEALRELIKTLGRVFTKELKPTCRARACDVNIDAYEITLRLFLETKSTLG